MAKATSPKSAEKLMKEAEDEVKLFKDASDKIKNNIRHPPPPGSLISLVVASPSPSSSSSSPSFAKPPANFPPNQIISSAVQASMKSKRKDILEECTKWVKEVADQTEAKQKTLSEKSHALAITVKQIQASLADELAQATEQAKEEDERLVTIQIKTERTAMGLKEEKTKYASQILEVKSRAANAEAQLRTFKKEFSSREVTQPEDDAAKLAKIVDVVNKRQEAFQQRKHELLLAISQLEEKIRQGTQACLRY
eukprot:TRINITY_DN1110_c0_g1_i4.p1 TRINITY_DN1110_c0_g1~~TRINITY_DN1110_c0_g1_i4.p1  ORF type:complete len:277 (+),score=88.59 TRINITY_DN1110_c0_g1_i4:73-831(+)